MTFWSPKRCSVSASILVCVTVLFVLGKVLGKVVGDIGGDGRRVGPVIVVAAQRLGLGDRLGHRQKFLQEPGRIDHT